ncbi:MAG: Flp pilus assembly complex ATPase component TadA, partial [Planctomycetes bacterium]|nr:Flp pilus assembly complex ATPase component TadA [Planctomycetota bacterium]
MARKRLGEILKAYKKVDDRQIDQALKHAREKKCRVGEALVALGVITDVDLAKALAKQFDLRFVDLTKGEIPKEVLDAVPQAQVAEHNIVPVMKQGNTVTIAITDPTNLFTLDSLKFILGADVAFAVATPAAMQQAIAKHYAKAEGEFDKVIESVTGADIQFREEEEEQDAVDDDAPIIRLVEKIIADAIEARASDIHLEPMEGRVRIRYRIDGNCQEVDSLKKALQGPVLQRVKIMAKMDIAERRKPQDGRIQTKFAGKPIDMRVSALPGTHGESIVMRILDKEANMVSLDQLGFAADISKKYYEIIKRPNGIFLVTGPTGSGKTTTLYASLQSLNRSDVKIITAEDPVEYMISGINQCQVHHQIELTFARILRAMLRQAPNVILVGEIRDQETAEIAIQAALTGHLVFSTLHTNDSVSALTRLIDMGVKPFLVASSIQAILAQRLVRRLCPQCKKAYTPSEVELRMVGLRPEELAGKSIFRATKGGKCQHCKGQGYRGRMGVHELLELNEELREMTFHRSPTHAIKGRAKTLGRIVTLQEDGVRKVLNGATSIEEVLEVIHREDIKNESSVASSQLSGNERAHYQPPTPD